MSKKVLLIGAVVAVAAVAGYYFTRGGSMSMGGSSSCTAEEYAAKAQAAQTAMMEMQQSNPEGLQAVAVKMQDAAVAMQSNPNDFSAACKIMDEIVASAK